MANATDVTTDAAVLHAISLKLTVAAARLGNDRRLVAQIGNEPAYRDDFCLAAHRHNAETNIEMVRSLMQSIAAECDAMVGLLHNRYPAFFAAVAADPRA